MLLSKESSQYIRDVLEERKLARLKKDYAKADAIRDDLLSIGIHIEDQPNGKTLWSAWSKVELKYPLTRKYMYFSGRYGCSPCNPIITKFLSLKDIIDNIDVRLFRIKPAFPGNWTKNELVTWAMFCKIDAQFSQSWVAHIVFWSVFVDKFLSQKNLKLYRNQQDYIIKKHLACNVFDDFLCGLELLACLYKAYVTQEDA